MAWNPARKLIVSLAGFFAALFVLYITVGQYFAAQNAAKAEIRDRVYASIAGTPGSNRGKVLASQPSRRFLEQQLGPADYEETHWVGNRPVTTLLWKPGLVGTHKTSLNASFDGDSLVLITYTSGGTTERVGMSPTEYALSITARAR